ncbi:MAG: hypothetical protein PHS49_08065 [Candidatus Gracilibacteria bacterium]|nr:hypothetical protein [Candidatus Gracilibacteria bacterium]
MEYKIFRYVRHHVKIPYFLRFIFACFLIFLSIIPIVLPLFPGSLFVGLVLLVLGLMLIVPGNKIRHVIKIRKGIVYLTQNFHRKDTIARKMRDIKVHIRDILDEKQYIKNIKK